MFFLDFYFRVFLAVRAMKYIKPGAKPTIKGIHTGHPSAGDAMLKSFNPIIFKSILPFSIQN